MTKPTIAITGANGFLGSALVQHFANKGWRVVGLVRRPEKSSDGLVTYRQYDLTKPLRPEVLSGVDYVVHAAYVKYGRRGSPAAMEINVQGAGLLLSACKRLSVKKAVFISTMSAHDAATSVYGHQKLTIEKLFLASGDVVLRSGLIIGNGGIVRDMAAFMKSKHMAPVIGGGKQPLQIVAVYDLISAVEAALAPEVQGQFTVATPTVYTYRAFYQTLAKSLGITVIFVPIPYYVLMTVFKTAAFLHLPLNFNEDNLRGLRQLRSADTEPDLRRLGIDVDNLETALAKTRNSSGG